MTHVRHRSFRIEQLALVVFVLFAFSSCVVNAGRGVVIGENHSDVHSEIAWKPWAEAARGIKENHRAVLLYVIGAPNTDSKTNFDPSIFSINEVKQSCTLLTCVKLPLGNSDCSFCTSAGVVLLTSEGTPSARFETTPTKADFVAAIRKVSQPK